MSNVLVLNATYEPLGAVPLARAMWLVLDGRVEIVSADEDNPVRSATGEHPRPTVVRLIQYRKVDHSRKANLTRRAILQRDNYECCYCGGLADTMDHVTPRALKGRHRWENVVACCYRCNQKKDQRTLDELGWSMRYRPFRPEGGRRIVISTGAAAHPDWKVWLDAAGM